MDGPLLVTRQVSPSGVVGLVHVSVLYWLVVLVCPCCDGLDQSPSWSILATRRVQNFAGGLGS